MGKFSKHLDIDAVMQKAAKDLAAIEREYPKYLHAQNIPESLLAEIKSCLEGLRSSLDYLWCKVPQVKSGDHFPMANSKKDFENKTKGIDTMYSGIVEKWQQYNNQPWTGNFNILRNKNSHLTLIPQKRQETKEFSIKTPNSSATFRGCTFSGDVRVAFDGIPVSIDPKTQFPADVPGLSIERKIWIDFLFDGSSISPDFPTGISALPFLKESLEMVSKIISELEQTF